MLVARPAYLRAMKLAALRSPDRGDRDLWDTRASAKELGVVEVAAPGALHASVHGGDPAADLLAQFPAVLR